MVPPLNDELSPVNDEHVWAAQPTYSELAHTTFAGKKQQIMINAKEVKRLIDSVLLNVPFKNNVSCRILL